MSKDNANLSISKVLLTNFRQHSSLEVDLTNLNVVVGENGAGKTSILEGICYCLFGAVANGANKKELIKGGTKSGGVTLTLSNNYKIVRDFNGTCKLLDHKNKVVTERAIDVERYLSIDRNIFLNILYAAQNDIYSYFIKFNAKEKDFMDSLFNLSDLTDKIGIALKDTLTDLTNRYNTLVTLKQNKDTMQQYITNTLAHLNTQSIEELSRVIDGAYKRLTEYKEIYDKIETDKKKLLDYNNLKGSIQTLTNDIERISNKIKQNESSLNTAQNNLMQYVTQISTTLNTTIDPNTSDEFFKNVNQQYDIGNIVNKIIELCNIAIGLKNGNENIDSRQHFRSIIQMCQIILKIDQYRNYYNTIAKDINNLKFQLKLANNQTINDQNELARLQNNLAQFNQKFKEIEQEIVGNTSLDQQQKYQGFENIAQVYMRQQTEYATYKTSYDNLLGYQNQLNSMMVDDDSIEDLQLTINEINGIIGLFNRDGFVSYLRKTLLKEIANSIGDSLEKFGFTKLIPVDIDERSGALLFHDRPFRSLSGGEKTIAAILLRILYARLLAPSMKLNILMLDEPTADLDSIRVGYLRQMLSRISNMLKIQVIIVTHDAEVIPDDANLISINRRL